MHFNFRGIRVFTGTYNEYIYQALKSNGYSCFLNAHMTHEYHRNKNGFKNVIEEANFVLPDGMSVYYAVKMLGASSIERIAGNDMIFSLLERAREDNLKVFLVGSTDEILGKMKSKMDQLGIESMTYSPPYLPIHEFDFEHQEELISSFTPDIVLVGLGCPKQEFWMNRMKERIDIPMFGIGGAFLLYAGVDKRAPKWMRDFALEWVYRLSLEPKRLFKRYLITNSYFCIIVIKELLKKVFN